MHTIKFIVPLLIAVSCSTPRSTTPLAYFSATDTTKAVAETIADASRPLCGGYTGQREPTEEEFALFRHVTGSGDTVYTPLSVSTQVVAGLNYKFWCRYEDSLHCTAGHCWIVIYKDLQGGATLSSITPEE